MRILVIGINCFPELTGIGKYTGEMINWLVENNHDATMVTGFPYYPNWKVQEPYNGNFYKKEGYHKQKLVVYRCPMYIPSDPSGLKRMIHEGTFLISAFFVIFRLLFKPKYDLIFSVSPPFHLGFVALFYRFFKGGKIVYHVQDLQIEAAKQLKMLKPWMFKLLFKMEQVILKNTNFVSSISEGMIVKIQRKTTKNLLFFPNWVDTDAFFPLINRNRIKLEWGYQLSDTVVLYSGSIGEKQGLDSLVRIADKLRLEYHIKFIICGMGPYRKELIRLAEERLLTNLKFLPLQESESFNTFLNMADIHLVLQKSNASDLVMPSKLTNILSVGGLALVTANAGTTLYDIINKYDMGIGVLPESETALADAILKISKSDYDYIRINARQYALKYLNRKNILSKMIEDITKDL